MNKNSAIIWGLIGLLLSWFAGYQLTLQPEVLATKEHAKEKIERAKEDRKTPTALGSNYAKLRDPNRPGIPGRSSVSNPLFLDVRLTAQKGDDVYYATWTIPSVMMKTGVQAYQNLLESLPGESLILVIGSSADEAEKAASELRSFGFNAQSVGAVDVRIRNRIRDVTKNHDFPFTMSSVPTRRFL